jgi:hypothetical protein
MSMAGDPFARTDITHIPGIPEDLSSDFTKEPKVYVPKDVLKIRHLTPSSPYQEYLAFGAHHRNLLTVLPFAEFWSIWELLKARSSKLLEKEAAWYCVQKGSDFGDDGAKKDRLKWRIVPWKTTIKVQARSRTIDSTPFDTTTPARTKRKDYPTTAKDQMLCHKRAKHIDQAPMYTAEQKEAGVGACSAYA